MSENILGYSQEELTRLGGKQTAVEISNQPELWKKVYSLVLNEKDTLEEFFSKVLKTESYVILTGAGTSAFIGDALQGSFQRNTGLVTRSIPTTDLVTHPEDYFLKNIPTLLVSFARSGDSPESFAAVELANKLCSNISHLIITCNRNGKLGTWGGSINTCKIILPPETNDKSLAMTSSFTSMLLTGLLVSVIKRISDFSATVNRLSGYGQRIITQYNDFIKKVATKDFERAIFLGSGPLLGCARESHLKLQELTNGRIICKHDSYLGFRHGPKVVINEKSIISYLISGNSQVRKYELDLIRSITLQGMGFSFFVTENVLEEYPAENQIILSNDPSGLLSEEFLPVCCVLPAQMLGFHKSVFTGASPDSPSVDGTITRVVSGVTIYDYNIMTGR